MQFTRGSDFNPCRSFTFFTFHRWIWSLVSGNTHIRSTAQLTLNFRWLPYGFFVHHLESLPGLRQKGGFLITVSHLSPLFFEIISLLTGPVGLCVTYSVSKFNLAEYFNLFTCSVMDYFDLLLSGNSWFLFNGLKHSNTWCAPLQLLQFSSMQLRLWAAKHLKHNFAARSILVRPLGFSFKNFGQFIMLFLGNTRFFKLPGLPSVGFSSDCCSVGTEFNRLSLLPPFPLHSFECSSTLFRSMQCLLHMTHFKQWPTWLLKKCRLKSFMVCICRWQYPHLKLKVPLAKCCESRWFNNLAVSTKTLLQHSHWSIIWFILKLSLWLVI